MTPTSTRILPMRQSTDRLIEELAGGQHRIVTRKQLQDAGISDKALRRRVGSGWLQRRHRGVYQVGPVAGAMTAEMAAILACGSSAVISHESAARLHGIPISGTSDAPVDISVPSQVFRSHPRIRVHRVQELSHQDITQIEHVPVVTPARTICDLAAVLATRDLEVALAFSLREHMVSEKVLRECAQRSGRRRGVARILSILDTEQGPAFTRSEAEARFLELIRGTGIREPRTNARAAGLEVDFLWRRERVIVEVDGYQYHGNRHRYQGDRTRDQRLAAEGYQVIRITWQDITDRGPAVLVSLARALALRAS